MPALGRPPVKKRQIIEAMRRQIVGGALAPGARVPTRRELSRQFAGTLTTVQQALASLERDGFVVSRGKRGTFVADAPPHLHQVALIFPVEPDSATWGLYWDHLASAARHVIREQGLRLSIYTGIDAGEPGEDYERLLADIRNERLAGLIFTVSPFAVAGTDILNRPGLPRVAMTAPGALNDAVGAVALDSPGFAQRAAACLAERGVTRAAVIGQPGNEPEALVAELASAGIACPYQLQHAVTLNATQWAKHLTRLMFDPGTSQRPDGLIVLDDNLFDDALAGILDAGCRVADELTIVTHSNFPWQVSCPVPVVRLGYDMHALLTLFLEELESQRAGNPPQARQLQPVFEHELPLRAHTEAAPSTLVVT
jgi:DNA-binding LacI/PurR family transcriptional regulator